MRCKDQMNGITELRECVILRARERTVPRWQMGVLMDAEGKSEC